MADAVKDAVEGVKEGVKNLALGKDSKDSKDTKEQKPKKEKKKKATEGGEGRPTELSPKPAFFDHRIAIFDKLKAKYDEEVARKPRESITITMPDGKTIVGESWVTSPADVARGISKSLFERTVIARIDKGTPNETLWDLERPLEKSVQLEFLDFEHEEGKKVFWHSSAHVLGEASERRFGCDLYGSASRVPVLC